MTTESWHRIEQVFEAVSDLPPTEKRSPPRLGTIHRHPAREPYVRAGGQWTYLYRAIDAAGNTIDFLLSPKARPDRSQRLSPACIVAGGPTSAASHQRRWPSGLSACRRTTKVVAATKY